MPTAYISAGGASERYELGSALLREHGLSLCGWRFAVDRARARAGQCNFTTKTISVSKHFLWDVGTTDSEYRNIVLHEIAHALAGREAGHGPAWKEVALSIGCDGDRCLNRAVSRARFTVTCPCGAVCAKRHSVKQSLLSRVCTKCNGPLAAKRTV